jgi:hypothetical protein
MHKALIKGENDIIGKSGKVPSIFLIFQSCLDGLGEK